MSSTNIKTPFPVGMSRVLQLSFFFMILFFTGQTKKRTSTLNESIPETTGSHAILNSFSEPLCLLTQYKAVFSEKLEKSC